MQEENFHPMFKIAKETFGLTSLYPWQQLVIANIFDGYNASIRARELRLVSGALDELVEPTDEDGAIRSRQIVLLPTGAGKSLCFQVPSQELSGPTLVIYPLLALMADQERSLSERGIECVLLRGSQTPDERDCIFQKIKAGVKFIIANPEVLQSEKLLSQLLACNIAHFVIDEAHCVAQWGDSFRPSYLTLGEIIKKLNPPAITAFTATASPFVLERISEVLFNGSSHVIRGNGDRPNIHYRVKHVVAKNAALVTEVIRSPRPLVIFCGSRNKTEAVSRMLQRILYDSDIRFYHAGLSREEKKTTENWFHSHKRGILVCTCAWGMGVDKRDIKSVIHYNYSPSPEAYVQEAGRAARDGSIAVATLLWSPEDSRNVEKALKEDARVSSSTNLLFYKDYVSDKFCRRQILLEALGEIPKERSESLNLSTSKTSNKDAPLMIACETSQKYLSESEGDFFDAEEESFSVDMTSEEAQKFIVEKEDFFCSGCDVCKGKLSEISDLSVGLLFVKKNNRRYNEEEATELLLEDGNQVFLSKTFYKKGDVPFRPWESKDIKEILSELQKQGLVERTKFFPAKDRLFVTKKGEQFLQDSYKN